MSKRKVKCDFCNISFNRKGIGAHLRFCKAKKETSEHAIDSLRYANKNSEQAAEVSHAYQRYLEVRSELDLTKGQLQRKERVLNSYRECLRAAGSLLDSLVDVSEIN